jgi:hypothetical protein
MIQVTSEQQIWREAMELLLTKMSPSKAVRILSAIQLGTGDYTEARKQLIPETSLEELSSLIRKSERK